MQPKIKPIGIASKKVCKYPCKGYLNLKKSAKNGSKSTITFAKINVGA
jgi:hypothetical protein